MHEMRENLDCYQVRQEEDLAADWILFDFDSQPQQSETATKRHSKQAHIVETI